MAIRILHLLPSLEPAAIVTQLRLLLAGLSSTEFEHHICAVRDVPNAVAPHSLSPARVDTLHRLRPFDLAAWRRLKQLVREVQPTVLHTWNCGATVSGLVAHRLHFGGPVIATLRRPERLASWPLQNWQRRQCDRVTAIVVRNELAAAAVRCLSTRGLVEAIADGVPEVPAGIDRSLVRQELGLPGERRLLVTAARFEQATALRDVIWVSDILNVMRSDVDLCIVGDGADRARLLRFSNAVQARERIRFVEPSDDLIRWIQAADVYVQPSQPPAPPWGMLQALAAGVPVVAADCAMARAITPSVAARLLVSYGDRAGLARETNRVLNDHDLACTVAAAGVEHVRRLFPPAELVRRYDALYRQCVTGR